MEKPIVNRVEKSPLISIDLEEWYSNVPRSILDIKDWLHEGIILKEKEFRAFVEAHDWSQYKDSHLIVKCSVDAIIPSWAYLLVATYASPFAIRIVEGTTHTLDTILFTEFIDRLDVTAYKDKPIVIKGCAKKEIPLTAYLQLISKLQPIAKNIMFGEPCSTVPLYRKK